MRKEMRESLDTEKQIAKYVKPLGDKELLKQFSPIFDKMQKMLFNEFGVLHNYCRSCPLLFRDIKDAKKEGAENQK